MYPGINEVSNGRLLVDGGVPSHNIKTAEERKCETEPALVSWRGYSEPIGGGE